MCITLDHVVPTQHEIEKHPGTRVLTEKERKEFSKYAKVRNGLFTADEDDIIVKNWKKFCKVRINYKHIITKQHKIICFIIEYYF